MFNTDILVSPEMVGKTRPYIDVLPGSSKSTASEYDLEREFIASMQELMTEEPSAIITQEDIEQQIRLYERQYGFSSAQMLEMVRNNTAPDAYEIMDWRILLGHR